MGLESNWRFLILYSATPRAAFEFLIHLQPPHALFPVKTVTPASNPENCSMKVCSTNYHLKKENGPYRGVEEETQICVRSAVLRYSVIISSYWMRLRMIWRIMQIEEVDMIPAYVDNSLITTFKSSYSSLIFVSLSVCTRGGGGY